MASNLLHMLFGPKLVSIQNPLKKRLAGQISR